MSQSRSEPTASRTPLGERPAFPGGLEEVAPGAFAWIQPNGELGESNAGLVVGEGAAAVIDTLWDEELAARMLEAMAEARGEAPISTVINTHGDGDHWYGNGLFEGASIVATEAAAVQMRQEPPSAIARMRPLARAAGLAGALPVPGRARLRGLAAFGAALANYRFEEAKPRLPDRTFSGESELEVGARRLELIEVGPAHTAGDAFVWLPAERVLFSGDIVFNGVTPILWAGPVSNWIAALERIRSLAPERVVPGHGPVCGLEPVEELIGYWRWLAERVTAESADAGGLAAELVGSAEYRDSPWGSWRAPERTVVNVSMLARERRGEAGPVGLRKRIALFAEMGALRARLQPE